MDTSKLKPNDPRVKYESAEVRGKTYAYILGEPQGPKRDTIFLCHGWPDFNFGWRYQIPYLMSLGYQVVAPNLLGYPGTSSPEDLKHFSLKSMSDDIRELAKKFVGEDGQIILGGHDWGAAFAWRVAYWHPTLIKALFNACVPPNHPTLKFTELEVQVKSGKIPTFGYQLQFAGPEPQDYFRGKDKLRLLFKIMAGTKTPAGRYAFTVKKGFHFDRVPDVAGESPIMTVDEVEHYASEFAKNEAPEMKGPFNWYRIRRIMYEEELERVKAGYPFFFEMPVLYFAANLDDALPPSMAKTMDKYFLDLTRKELNTGHWIMAEDPEGFNAGLGQWLNALHKGTVRAML